MRRAITRMSWRVGGCLTSQCPQTAETMGKSSSPRSPEKATPRKSESTWGEEVQVVEESGGKAEVGREGHLEGEGAAVHVEHHVEGVRHPQLVVHVPGGEER